MNDIQQLLLASLTNSPNRAKAEQDLIQILINNPEQFRLIGQMIIEQYQQESLEMVIVLNEVIKIMLNNKKQLGQLYKITFFEIFTATNIPSKYKCIIKSSMQRMLQDEEYYQALNCAMKMKISHDQQQQLVSIQIFKLLFDFLIFDRIGECPQNCGWLAEFFNDICRVIKLADIQDPLYSQFLQTLEECFCILFKYDKQDYIHFQNVVFQNQEISQLLLSIFSYQSEFHLIYCQNNTVEQIKISALKCYKHLVFRLLKSRNKEQQLIFPIYKNHSILLPHLVQSLQYTKIELVTKFIVQLLNISIYQHEYYNFFQSCYRDLIESKLYQCLIFSTSQISQVNDDPQGFNDYLLNFDLNSESELLHVEILKFINSIVLTLDGASTYLASSSIILFKFSINQISQTQINAFDPQEITYIENIKNKSIIQNYDAKQRLQGISILLISLFPLFKERQDIQQYINKILLENLQFFMMNSDQLFQILYCKFVDISFQYSKSINSEFKNKFLDQIKSTSYKNRDAYFYQAIQTINTIMKYNGDKNSLLLDDLMTYYSGVLISANDVKMLQLLEEWVQEYQLQFETLLIIATYASQRIEQEQQILLKQMECQEIIIDTCWNLIIKIATNFTYFDHLIQLEQKILPLYKQFYLNENVQYSEKLIQFIILIISKIQRVTLEQSQLLPAFQKILKQQGYVFHELFDLLNNYIYYGREYFLDENSQLIYFKLALENLASTENEPIEKCEGALLIQLGIQCLRSDIKENILCVIFETAFSMITQQQLEDILSSRILCIFLSAFLTVKNISEKIIGDSYNKIKNELFGMNYTAGYDTKLFIIFYSNSILQNPNLLIETGSIIVSMLSYQMEQDSDEKWYQPDDEFEEDELACQEFDQDEEKKLLDAQINKFKSGYVGVDEFETFKQAIHQIKLKHPNIIEQFKQSLHAFTLVKLKQILSSTRAQFEKPRQIFKVNKRKSLYP